ncbi:hypothetical protein LCGC14_2461700, partial [marine sediment metagenome]
TRCGAFESVTMEKPRLMPSIAHLMNRTVSVQRMGATADGQGGFTETPGTVLTVKGRRQPAGSRDRIVAGREETEVTHVWYFDGAPDVKVRDLLVSGSNKDEVLALVPPSEPDHLKVLAKEFQIGATT